jgi:hypothetical protein
VTEDKIDIEQEIDTYTDELSDEALDRQSEGARLSLGVLCGCSGLTCRQEPRR